MDLHFSWNDVEELLDEIRTAKIANPLYGRETGKGIWLVGDQGVYLMANTTDGPREKARKKGDHAFVVYAKECDPMKLEFDEWWANKRASLGGDDGVDFLSLAKLEGLISSPPATNVVPRYFIVNLTPEKLSFRLNWQKIIP